MKCNQCDSATINGVFCHEAGCPNTNKIWDAESESWIEAEFEDEDYWDEDYQSGPEDFEEEL